MSGTSKRIVVPLSGLASQFPTIVPWLDRLVPGVVLMPAVPRVPGGANDVMIEARARANYSPRQGLVPWHAAELARGWGIDVPSPPRGLGWKPLNTYDRAGLEEDARETLARQPLASWLRDLPGEPRTSYQWATIGYAVEGVTAMALHFGPGAGKTRAALDWSLCQASFQSLSRRIYIPPIIVTTPSNVVRHWERQVRKWTMLQPLVWTAVSRRTKRDHAAMNALAEWNSGPSPTEPVIVIVSHDNIVDAWPDLHRLPSGIVVFDESHLFRGTKRWQAVPTEDGKLSFSERTTASGERTQSVVLREVAEWATVGRIELTATPIGNRFSQLWVQMDLLDPGGFGSYYVWSARHALGRPGEYGGWDATGSANIEEHRARVRYFFYEVPMSESHRNLPPKRRETVYLPVSEQVAELGGWTKIIANAKKLGRSNEMEAKLMQAASRKRRYVVSRAVETVLGGGKVCVLTGRRRDVHAIADAVRTKLEGVDSTLWSATGEDAQDERADRCAAYMAWRPEEHGGKGAVLVGTLDCLGIGIDLQDTDLLLVAMLPWTWDVLWQAENRVFRLGMTRSVLIEFVIAEGTLDEYVCQSFLAKLPAIGAATPDEEVAKVGESLRGLSDTDGLLDRIFDRMAASAQRGEGETVDAEATE